MLIALYGFSISPYIGLYRAKNYIAVDSHIYKPSGCSQSAGRVHTGSHFTVMHTTTVDLEHNTVIRKYDTAITWVYGRHCSPFKVMPWSGCLRWTMSSEIFGERG